LLAFLPTGLACETLELRELLIGFAADFMPDFPAI
jgi:hypothetical protein